MTGALKVGDPRTWWFDALEQLAARPLVLRPEHVAAVHALPPVHKDPFDRVLIAQATIEDLTLLTTDGEIPQYASARYYNGGEEHPADAPQASSIRLKRAFISPS
jgi:PIN domain nuclease of toxin-antitoxin system